MANEVFSNESIIKIGQDSIVSSSGTVTRDNNTLKLGANSKCKFSYSYDTPLQTTQLKVVYDINGSEESTRYNNNIGIQLKVHLSNADYENGEIKYTDGEIESIDIIPYKNTEEKGNYNNELINLRSNYIKKIEVILYFYSDEETDNITFRKLGIYNTVVISEESVHTMIETYIPEENKRASCIDVLSADPDPTTVPNGVNAPYCYMWILRSALE